MPVVTASNRGQIVIPREIRKKLNIGPGKRIAVKLEGDHVLLIPLPDDPVESFCGIFKDKASLTRELMEQKKKEREHEAKKLTG